MTLVTGGGGARGVAGSVEGCGCCPAEADTWGQGALLGAARKRDSFSGLRPPQEPTKTSADSHRPALPCARSKGKPQKCKQCVFPWVSKGSTVTARQQWQLIPLNSCVRFAFSVACACVTGSCSAAGKGSARKSMRASTLSGNGRG